MSRTQQFLSFFSVVLSIVALVHAYLWWRLIHAPELPRNARVFLTAALIALACSVPLSFFANRHFATPWREIALWSGYVWMGFMFLLFVALLAAEIPRLGLWVVLRADPSRWLSLSRAVTAATCLLVLGAGIFAILNAARGPAVRNVRVTLPNLPRELSGTTIAQISDLHVGGILRRNYVEKVVRRTNELRPDLVAITGDLVDGAASRDRHVIEPIGNLNARYGVFFVTGNHEYYSGVEPWLEAVRELGVRVLRNERVTVGTEAASFDLAGVDDSSAGRLAPGHGPDVPRALAGRDPARASVLLAHQPREIGAAASLNVGLQISGHTHAGQIWPFGLFVGLAQPFVSGLARRGDTQIYVSPGAGFWGPPMRLGMRSEIARIELVSPDAPE